MLLVLHGSKLTGTLNAQGTGIRLNKEKNKQKNLVATPVLALKSKYIYVTYVSLKYGQCSMAGIWPCQHLPLPQSAPKTSPKKPHDSGH